jgi:hypothetical protein
VGAWSLPCNGLSSGLVSEIVQGKQQGLELIYLAMVLSLLALSRYRDVPCLSDQLTSRPTIRQWLQGGKNKPE